MLICMISTLNIENEILEKAFRLTGVREKNTLVRMRLEALIARQSAKRLAAFGGNEPAAKSVTRGRKV